MQTSVAPSARPCPVCRSIHKRLLFTQRFRGASEGSLLSSYEVVVCEECGFGYADQIPSQAEFDVYYRQMSKYEHQHRAGQESEYDSRRFRQVAQLIRDHLSNQHARVLDIGCANGGLLNGLRQVGFREVLGIDPSPVCAETAQRLYGIRVLSGTLSSLPPEVGLFDLVILGSVLEHVRDLDSAMRDICSLLVPRGKLYVDVPDATRFVSAQDAPFQEFSIEHINYFSPMSLTNLAHVYHFREVFIQRNAAEPAPGSLAHEIRAMFEHTGADSTLTIARDPETEAGLVAYIASSAKIEQRIHAAIDPWVDGGQPIFVWGVGTHTQRLLATSRLAQAKVRAFVDSNLRYQGKLINGIPVIAPSQLAGTSEPILVSSYACQREICRQIRNELQLQNQLILLYDL